MMRSLTGLSVAERRLLVWHAAHHPGSTELAGALVDARGQGLPAAWSDLVGLASSAPPGPGDEDVLVGRVETLASLLAVLVPEATGVAGEITHVRIVPGGGRLEHGDFYEDDEPVEDVVAAFDRGQQGLTARPGSDPL